MSISVSLTRGVLRRGGGGGVGTRACSKPYDVSGYI